MARNNVFISILREKCPNCRNGSVFEPSQGLFKMPVMKNSCAECGYRFNREPGYFLGAMYVSYGIAVAAALATFLVFYFFFPDAPTLIVPVAMAVAIIAVAKWNYRISRVIYMYIFKW